jgi:hypothetical protein
MRAFRLTRVAGLERTATRPRGLLLAAAALIVLLALASRAAADSPPGPYFNGFETNTSNWFGAITRVPSGYSAGAGSYAPGIPSGTGGWHARVSGDPCAPPVPCSGPFTRWGGYSQTFPTGGYRTQIDIYLDVDWAIDHPDARFDFISAINNSAGTHLRDFVFNAGTDPSSAPGFYVNASTNSQRHSSFPENPCPAPASPPNVCRRPAHITDSGWYTFRHTFRDDGGVLAVDMDIFGGSGSVANWTIHSGDSMSTVGGNRYGWFANEEIPELAIDNSQRSGYLLDLTPATARNQAGTSHTVTATLTTTDQQGHPSPGAGVAVEFDVISGPNSGQSSEPANIGCSTTDCTTGASGSVSWTYTSNGMSGTDTIRACFAERPATVQNAGDEQRTCDTATKTWGSFTGKVTGGGQVQGDPVFSPAGDLISLPALVPSLAGPSSQATFGFTVTCCAPKGNLEYNDHQMGVRIKAQSITELFVSSPGASCSATPGSKHATFKGTASVIRSTGTTTEPFTVDVDDCGEPGTADTFGIQTTSYSNGPNSLIGGNIQIHKG